MNDRTLCLATAVMALCATLAQADDPSGPYMGTDPAEVSGGDAVVDVATVDYSEDDPAPWGDDETFAQDDEGIDGAGTDWDAGDGDLLAMDDQDAAPSDPDCGERCVMPVISILDGPIENAAGGHARRSHHRNWEDVHKANQRNVCFEADLYIPALCDWQRPFLGDRMP